MRIFHFLPMRAMMPRSLPGSGTFHLARPGFSFFANWSGPVWKVGRLWDMRRMWRVRKPEFCVENEG